MEKGKKKEIEYTALREEYLILENRIHDLWKWGLISIIAILSSILFYFFEMAKDDTSYKIIKTNISNWKILILLILILIPSIITVLLGYMISKIKYVMKRLTGYLTVFHDINDSNEKKWDGTFGTVSKNLALIRSGFRLREVFGYMYYFSSFIL